MFPSWSFPFGIKKDAFVFGIAQQAAESDGTKRVTVPGVGSGSYRFLVTFSSLVYLVFLIV